MVEIYVIPIAEEFDISSLKEKISYLPHNLKSQSTNGNSTRQGMISFLGYAFVQHIIQKRLQSKKLFDISYTKQGKPFFTDFPNIHFNISHSGLYICIAISNENVGIDIERIRTCKPSIVKRFFHKQEAEDILAISLEELQNVYFTQIWSLKESYVKCIGTGMANVFDTFFVQIKNNQIIVSGNTENVYFKSYNLLQGYQLSVCSFSNSFCESPAFLSIETLLESPFVNL